MFWFDVGFIFAYNRVSRYLTVTRDVLLIVTYRRSNTSSTTSRPKITSTTLSLSLGLWLLFIILVFTRYIKITTAQTVRLSVTLHVMCGAFLILQIGMKEEDIRKSREELTLGNIPSRGEWLL